METFEKEGLKHIQTDWPNWHAHEGRTVLLRTPDGGSHTGMASGLDAAGNLLLTLPNGEMRKFSTGEVSLRPVAAK